MVGKDYGVAFEGMDLQIPMDSQWILDVKFKAWLYRNLFRHIILVMDRVAWPNMDTQGRLIVPSLYAVA